MSIELYNTLSNNTTHSFYLIKNLELKTFYSLVLDFFNESLIKFNLIIEGITCPSFLEAFKIIQSNYEYIINALKECTMYYKSLQFIVDAIKLWKSLNIFVLYGSFDIEAHSIIYNSLVKSSHDSWLKICKYVNEKTLGDGLETIMRFAIARYYYLNYNIDCSDCRGDSKITPCDACVQYLFTVSCGIPTEKLASNSNDDLTTNWLKQLNFRYIELMNYMQKKRELKLKKEEEKVIRKYVNKPVHNYN